MADRYDLCACGERKRGCARRCRRCARGGRLVSEVIEHYPEESAQSIAARLGTTPMAVYNTASRLRRRLPGSVGYRRERD